MKKRDVNLDLDQQYLEKLENIIFQPVFIMGVQRSGTSILYKIFTATQLFNPVTTYHIIRYPELIHNHINNQEQDAKNMLAEFLKNNSQSDRGIDGLKITPDFPEEYGFLLGQKTEQTKLAPKNLPVFIELCKKIQFISDPKKPLLLKNPWDFSNFIYIKQVFPTAKFIFIHRNPLKTLNSQIKAMRYLLQNKSPYMALLSPWYRHTFDNKLRLLIYRFLYSSHTPFRVNSTIKTLTNNVNYFLKNIELLNQEEYICMRYEDLCKDPESTISKILDFLGLKIKSNINYYDFIKTRETILLEEVQIRKSTILKRMKTYLSYCNYPVENLE
jgi:hypothetical protein